MWNHHQIKWIIHYLVVWMVLQMVLFFRTFFFLKKWRKKNLRKNWNIQFHITRGKCLKNKNPFCNSTLHCSFFPSVFWFIQFIFSMSSKRISNTSYWQNKKCLVSRGKRNPVKNDLIIWLSCLGTNTQVEIQKTRLFNFFQKFQKCEKESF